MKIILFKNIYLLIIANVKPIWCHIVNIYTLKLTIIFKLEIINYYEIQTVVISLILIWFK